jgi:hypothetical protein
MSRRALEYPYSRPEGDFLYIGGKCLALEAADPDQPGRSGIEVGGTVDGILSEMGGQPVGGWVAVVAYGSNQSPAQLERKFPVGVPVISVQGRLRDMDALRSAHFSAYGSLPATPATSPGTLLGISLQWLPLSALPRLHASEGLGRNYLFAQLPSGKLEMACGVPREAWIYMGMHGSARIRGAVSAFSELGARGRIFPEHSQPTALELVRRELGVEEELKPWLQRLCSDPGYRMQMSRALKRAAAP